MKVQKKLLLDNTAARHKMAIRPPKKHEIKHRDAVQKNGTSGLVIENRNCHASPYSTASASAFDVYSSSY